jgi:hypothetical protein
LVSIASNSGSMRRVVSVKAIRSAAAFTSLAVITANRP